MKKKRKLIKRIYLIVLPLLIAVWIFNNFTIKTVETAVSSAKISGEIKIALVSDLHLSFYTNCRKIVKAIGKTEPDVIFVLGDMYSKGQTQKIADVCDFMQELAKIADVYTVVGDHDYDDEYKDAIRKLENIYLLDYEFRDIEIKGNKLRIYGINNAYFSSTFDLSREFDPPLNDRTNILLSHIPSMKHYGDFGFDYIFSGDTHGGMVRLPFLGGIYYNGYILPKITYSGEITDKGLYEYENTSLYVTSGVGHYPLPLRFGCRPEICLIKIKGE
ncbi:MAG: metallophosphoesterase [Clostridia bacterium]|nr:metallophosphoesterase [Clostridia bacterium]